MICEPLKHKSLALIWPVLQTASFPIISVTLFYWSRVFIDFLLLMEMLLKLTFLACLVKACFSQCLPKVISQVVPSNGSCPSESVVAESLEELRSRVNAVIDKELPFLQRSISDGCPGEGWVKVVDFNTTNCPDGMPVEKEGDLEYCTLASTQDCASRSANYLHGYSQVCGRALGIQVGPLTGFGRYIAAPSLEENYLDGISVTYGSSPRTHVWSMAMSGSTHTPDSKCPCDNSSCNEAKQREIDGVLLNHYFCDSASDDMEGGINRVYQKSLWYESGCLHDGCCRSSPYFYRKLPEMTTDILEVRICQNRGLRDAARVGVAKMELYVR